jgi:dTDP-4-dehydrorhamnose reductase
MSTEKSTQYCKPEIWGGLECTINRIENRYRDQLLYTGHYRRSQDIDAFASLGIKALRYPVLWERHQSWPDGAIDWQWITRQLGKIREHGIVPIAGLVHHGSGPRFTDLLDDKFADKLAVFAKKTATQFPWLEYFTPVNEPLTTARFSGLYGFWYPHKSDPLSFAKMLLNEVKGVVLSMKAIRSINPAAKLIQTEDLTRVQSTKLLGYQADFENERRWLTFDLLSGKVDRFHPMWHYLVSTGIRQSQLEFFLENTCPPDVLGLNYYVTSERFLDDRINLYPGLPCGGNGRHSYVDTDAVRVGRLLGPGKLIEEAWRRYGREIAITEAHLSCTREEQMRWFKEMWEACCHARQNNIPVRAVTAWSLLGAYDWNSLLTQDRKVYETGIFDVKGGEARPTAMTKLVSQLARGAVVEHPVLENDGWWHPTRTVKASTRPLLVIGRNGTLGTAFMKICERRNISLTALSRSVLDISSDAQIEHAIDTFKPWAVINASGYVKVDDAEFEASKCYEVNTSGALRLAKACKRHGLPYMTFSSDLVFNGKKGSPYLESDPVHPLSCYGKSKAEAERLVLTEYPSSLIIRTSAFFGPWDRYNFAHHVLHSLQHEREFRVPADVVVSPTYVPDLVHSALDLFLDEEQGLWHISNDGVLSWADFAFEIADRAGYKKEKIITKSVFEMGWRAPRPLYSVLKSSKGIRLPKLEDAIHNYFKEKI